MVRVSQRLIGCRQIGKLLCLTILTGMIAVAVGEAKGTLTKLNVTTSESPEELSTTTESPLIKKVTVEGEELVSLELGKAENESTPAPPFSNLWFNAGQSLGSAANSLTGWLNSRLVPQTTSTTTKPPEVIVRLQSNKGNRRPLIEIDQKKKPQPNRINAQQNNEDDDDPENEDEDTENEDEYDDNDEEEVSAQNSNKIRYPSNNVQEEEEDDDSNSDDENDGPIEEEDDDEDIVQPTRNRKNKRRKPNLPKPVNNRRRYEYEDEPDEYYNDDEDYDYDLPHRHSGRQQQQQSFLNRIRQLAQNSYGSGNQKPNRVTPTNKPNYRPVRILQNGQIVQLVQNGQNKQQANRRRRPAANQNTFQLIPINNNQLQGANQRPNRRRVARPNPANQFVIPLPQNPSFASQNGQKRPGQFITIPWSQLGISNPQEGSNQNIQAAAPIFVNIPQQNLKRRRRPIQRPTQVVSAPGRKRLGQPVKFRTQNGQTISVLTDENLRDIFRMPEIPPSRTPPEEMSSASVLNNRKRPLGTNEMQPIEVTTSKPEVSIKPDTEGEDDEEDTSEEPEPFIVVGDDNSTDEALPRHGISPHLLQIGGMKPYIDVLSKGRFYIKSGRQLRMNTDDRPETKVTAINPERTLLGGSDEILARDVTTDSSALTGGNASKMTLSLDSDDTSTTRKLLTR